MALSVVERQSLLKEINEYGAVLYYLLKKKHINIEEIENVLLKDNSEQVDLVFPKLILKIDPVDIDTAYALYSASYTKKDCISLVVSHNEKKYQHLKEIQDIALSDSLANDMVSDDTFISALNTHFMVKILDLINKDKKDAFLSIRDTIKNYKKDLNLISKENEKKICSDINNYYIGSIVGTSI